MPARTDMSWSRMPPRPWYRRRAFKILSFLFLTPLWAFIVWKDPDEKRAVKIFAAVVLAVGIGWGVAGHFSPDSVGERAFAERWEQGSAEERRAMLTGDRESDHASALLRISGLERTEVTALLGEPDAQGGPDELAYRFGTNAVLTIRFNVHGRVVGTSSAWHGAGSAPSVEAGTP